jgi:hypothetical protein
MMKEIHRRERRQGTDEHGEAKDLQIVIVHDAIKNRQHTLPAETKACESLASASRLSGGTL